jgi:hypothetical protein
MGLGAEDSRTAAAARLLNHACSTGALIKQYADQPQELPVHQRLGVLSLIQEVLATWMGYLDRHIMQL